MKTQKQSLPLPQQKNTSAKHLVFLLVSLSKSQHAELYFTGCYKKIQASRICIINCSTSLFRENEHFL